MKGISSKWKGLLSVCVVSICLVTAPAPKEAFSNQIIQRGAKGDDVIELQARLQNIGYYHGKIDGAYGWGTYWALRNFQEAFGLPIDGLAGESTKKKLTNASNFNKAFVHEQINKGNEFTYYSGVDVDKQIKQSETQSKPKTEKTEKTETTKSASVPGGYSQNDIQLMANAVYGESRGEPYIGQVAVAAVILNRVESPSFPNTISGVIFEPLAFTAVADGQIWLTPNEQAKNAVIDAMNGMDPTGQAEYYFNPDTATSKWIWTRPQIKKIGKHIFCK
ncbi:spore cortex-lytic enzyme [Peribacillus psychrosaccharolyticus]|uniref:Spore cortex-lytic enzyme n=1 Tax=Peribacillus psychrosaccharolyticus TaxID=1407 RepID=A0A974S092_PERPY|nr:spore cortex-lytic enzyme [Peribacillus psychrosaccharolyticus]MEC2056742.1 spore cortex-lytic enzyme [Peribacillus psychrosaccharolyticus]MED3746196.1 spore cortex-lytic enzyme [Peribacillus psychrosaccharolyticus]QQT00133.1 spore cortex-lytic enzyme [Peribacillus psychrosaccharolyticus]